MLGKFKRSSCPGQNPFSLLICVLKTILYSPSLMSWNQMLVTWCLEPRQPLGIISGLKTNCNSSLSRPAHTQFKHNISTAHLKSFTTNTHIHNISTEPKYFNIIAKILLHTKFTSTHLIHYRTYQFLIGSQKISPDSHFATVNIKISPQNVSL